MALILSDRVQETATANTTVSFTLLGAVTGYQSFAVLANNDTTYYGASDGTNWEVGLGTYSTTGPTLTRTTIYSSSNAGSAVTFSGTVTVFIDYPATRSVYEDSAGNVAGYPITGGSINNTPIGGSTANSGAFTTLSASSTVSGTGFSTYLASPPAIGGTAANAVSATTLSASSTVSGTGFSTYLASPPAIGGTAANAVSATTLSASSTVSGTGFTNYFASPPAIGSTAANTGAFTTLTLTNALALGQGGTGATTAPAASAALTGFTSTATAGGTTTLTNTSSIYQVFTGTSAQTVALPSTATLTTGWSFHIVNNSTKILTVQTSTGVVLDLLSPGSTLMPTVLSTAGNTAADWEVGYTDLSVDTRQVPQNAQTGNYTLDTTDIGKHIYHASGAGAAVYTIPANSAVPYEIGTAFTFINLSTTAPTIAITTDTMYLAGTGTTGTRTLAQYGVATAIKITATEWIISGSGLT